MSDSNSQLAERPSSVKDYLALPAYKDRFTEVLRSRAPQFMAAITSLANSPALKDAEPRSVIAAAMVAATLDLPVNPTLGQAYVVAYQGVAQFQIGYKGIIQLALRSGQYKRLNAGPVSAGAFKGFDLVGEPVLDFTKNDPTQPTAGYFCAFETMNGFTKIVYWSKEQADAHGKKFSRAYAKGYSTPWKSDFDAMATKTVIKAALGRWGLLSIEMQKAVVHDQGAQDDVDAEVKYVDGGEDRDAGEQMPGDPKPDRPAPPKRAAKGAAAVRENVVDAVTEPVKEKPVESFADAAQATGPAPSQTANAAPATKPADTQSVVTHVPGNTRAFLSDGEKLTAKVRVLSTEAKAHDSGAGVIAKVDGDYVGDVRHKEGGVIKDGTPVPLPIWSAGRSLTLVLNGKKGPGGKVLAVVESAVEAQADTPVETPEF
jgi:recombination protein RecT